MFHPKPNPSETALGTQERQDWLRLYRAENVGPITFRQLLERYASLNGRKFAPTLARELGQRGIVTVSGQARGIDTAVHQASRATGNIGVIAGSIDIIYPQENTPPDEQMAEHGCILAELPFGREPRAQHFPHRNRIISGLALGVVVVEAALQSGSLITARLALEQGREVFAVPGSPPDPRATGTNNLIKQGAHLVQQVGDILDELPKDSGLAEPANDLSPSSHEAGGAAATARIIGQILEFISISPTDIDELVRECHCSAPAVMAALLELELAGRVQRLPGNRVCRLFNELG